MQSHSYYIAYQNTVKDIYKNGRLPNTEIVVLLKESIKMYRLCNDSQKDDVLGRVDALIDFLTEKEASWGMKY